MSIVKSCINHVIAKFYFRNSSIPKNSFVDFRSRLLNVKMHGGNSIARNCLVINSEIGFGSYVSNDTEIISAKIGRFCSIGPRVSMPTGKHPISEMATTSPYFYSKAGVAGMSFVGSSKFEEYSYAEYPFCRLIGNDVWIGGGATILEGVSLGDGSVIGAGALVTKDTPPYSVSVGVPARVVKYRYEERVIEELLSLRWWNKDEKWLSDNAEAFESPEELIRLLQEDCSSLDSRRDV